MTGAPPVWKKIGVCFCKFWLYNTQARRQKFSEGGSFDTARGLGAAQGSQKPLGIWCKILQSSNFQTLYSNFRKALFSITNF